MRTAKRISSSWYRLLMAISLLLVLLLSWGQLGAAMPARSANPGEGPGLTDVSAHPSTQLPTFRGTAFYDPGMGSPRAQEGVSVSLYGIPGGGGNPELLDSAVTGRDGTFTLYAESAAFESFAIVKDEPRGLVAGYASAAGQGMIYDPSMVVYPSSVISDVCCTDFYVIDPFVFYPLWRDRYLIVTTAAVVPALDDFIAYKEFLGFDMEVITVEELDPGGQGGNFLRSQIRDYERSLHQSLGGLKYVLLIGTDDTVPFLKIEPARDDWVRVPQDDWPKKCKDAGVPHVENMCGRSTDWFYVDLYSDWDSNNDGILGEAFWAEGYTRDDPPAFNVDVFVGRLPFDNPATVQDVLDTIMTFEQDGGSWKLNALQAGAMYDLGGEKWVPADDPTGVYTTASGPTDAGFLMERVWYDFLYAEGFSRVRLYEKDHPPTGYPPSYFSVDAPLSRAEMINQWSSQDYGLVRAAGHGGAGGIGRRTWANDYETYGQVENPTKPFPPDDLSLYEISKPGFLFRDDVSHMVTPSGKAPVLMVMACATGAWYAPNNLPAAYLAAGRISAWIGGTDGVPYRFEWQVPADGFGQSVDYIITDAIFRRHLPLGDAVWTGLDDHRNTFGANWGNGNWDSAFIPWDLYGDPSMTYWGNGPDLRAPWPMFHYDLPGQGETALMGPGALMQVYWTGAIAPTAPGSRTPSPVVGRDGRVVIGDGNGDVRAFAGGVELWSYATGGPIENAAALSLDGTAYVQATNGTLYAIKEDGTLRWSRTVGESDASPKIATSGMIYVGGSDNNGPGGSTRYLLMIYRPNGGRRATAVVDDRITTAPSIAPDGTVWVGTAAGTLYEMSYDLTTVISHSISPGFAIGDGLALADDADETVLVPTADGQVVAWSAANDTVRWTFTASDTVRSAPAVGQEGKVFVGSQDGKVYALQLSDGSKLWEQDTGGPVDSSPALDAVSVYVVGGDPATLYILRGADGAFYAGSTNIGGTAAGGSSPAIGDSKMVYVASSDGTLYAIGRYQMPRPPILRAREWPWEIYCWIEFGDPFAMHRLERRLPGGEWSLVALLEPGMTEYYDRGVTPGQHYQYRAAAVVSPKEADAFLTITATRQVTLSEYSPIVQVQALRAVPGVPNAPTVMPLSSSELHVSWTVIPSDTISLRILRLDPGQSEFQEIALVPGSVTEFVDTDLISDSLYSYVLQAVDEAGESGLSATGQGTTWARTLPAPRQVTVQPVDSSTFQVCWVPGANNLDSIVVRLPAGESDPDMLSQVLAGQNCFTDNYAYPYSFEYWVKHVADQDESDWAKSAPTTPPSWQVAHHVFLPLVWKTSGP